MIAINQFWCCLNPRERSIAAACLPSFIAGLGYITQEDFYGLWVAFGLSPTNKLVGAFIAIYGLIPSTITDIEGNVIPVFLFDGWFWPALVLYAFDPGLGCASLCKELRFPN